MKLSLLIHPALLAFGGTFMALPAHAQSVEIVRPGGILPAGVGSPTGPADRLAISLRMLAQNPYDVSALAQAGESALAVGDANAAISFLARAEELSPANGRIKASLASALVLVERPADSFRLFNDALALGIPEYQIAKDRGLAYDLTGDARRAQRDYGLALKHGSDDEVTRRLCLSLGISGDKDQALRQLEPLLRKQDQAAWRARAFILAMNGDIRGAETIAEQVAPPAMLPGLSTFLRRLAILTPAQRAAAANFGTMPGNQMQMAVVQPLAPFKPVGESGSAVLFPVSETASPATVAAKVDRDSGSSGARRRPGRDKTTLLAAALPPLPPRKVESAAPITVPNVAAGPSWSSVPAARRDAVRVAVIAPPSAQLPRRVDPPSGPAFGPALFEIPATLPPPPKVQPQPQPQMVVAALVKELPVQAPPVSPPSQQPVAAPAAKMAAAPPPTPGFSDVLAVSVIKVLPAPVAEPAPKAEGGTVFEPITSTVELVRSEVQPDPAPKPEVQIVTPPPVPAVPIQVPSPEPKSTGLASILDGIEPEQESSGGAVLSDVEFRKARLAAKRKATADAAAALEADTEVTAAAERKRIASLQPERIWVQVATGSNRAGLGGTLSRLREKAPDALKGVGGATVSFKATNRVLVGPFKSQAEARGVINKLSKQGVAATSWTSSRGQDVAKLPSR